MALLSSAAEGKILAMTKYDQVKVNPSSWTAAATIVKK